ncbi:MAG: thiamine pyrophosphate-binding protein [Minwuia sp.]|uniref:thiamine pyrophosphate-binding protein n=1 Tax=Minwuia sp. TaxID=2493630 RepID=UPI003A8464F3
MTTFAEALVAALHARGTRHLFGVPGGGSSLDLIEACGKLGVQFVMARGETAAVLMAAATAEITGAPGAALAGVGPGAASAVNGMAYCMLERAPVVLFTDRVPDDPNRPSWHQKFDQTAMFAPVAKHAAYITPATSGEEIAALLDAMTGHPAGPAHVDMTAAEAGRAYADAVPAPQSVAGALPPELERMAAMLDGTMKVALIAGIQSRHAGEGVRALAAALNAACLTTYKAKGAIADDNPRLVAQFTGGTAEAAVLHEAGIVVLAGHDPVEAIPGKWLYDAPVLALSTWDWTAEGGHPAPEIMAVGDLDAMARQLAQTARGADWDAAIAGHRKSYRNRVAYPAVEGVSPDDAVNTVQVSAGEAARLCCDAGAHMIPALAQWIAREPVGVLKSNGLSTMGYALPAAIGSALADPDRPVVAITGDGGAMMCLGEMATAAELGLDITYVVLNDSALSLIDVKQRNQQRPRSGVASETFDFATISRGFGWPAATVDRLDHLQPSLDLLKTYLGPKLLDIRIDPSGYGAQFEAMRG